MPGIAISDISDHYPVFALIPFVKHLKNNARQIWKRDMKNFKAEHFIEDLTLFGRGGGSIRPTAN